MGKEEQGQADEVQKGVQREEKDAENGKWRILGITIVYWIENTPVCLNSNYIDSIFSEDFRN